MVSRSLSKSYALAGLRFGYLVAQPHDDRAVGQGEGLVQLRCAGDCRRPRPPSATRQWLAANRAKILATRAPAGGGNAEARVCDGRFAGQFHLEHASATAQPNRSTSNSNATHILVRYMNYPGWGDGLRISVGTDAEIDACLEKLRGDGLKPRTSGQLVSYSRPRATSVNPWTGHRSLITDY